MLFRILFHIVMVMSTYLGLSGYTRTSLIRMEKSQVINQDLLLRGTHKLKELILMRLFLLLSDLEPFVFSMEFHVI